MSELKDVYDRLAINERLIEKVSVQIDFLTKASQLPSQCPPKCPGESAEKDVAELRDRMKGLEYELRAATIISVELRDNMKSMTPILEKFNIQHERLFHKIENSLAVISKCELERKEIFTTLESYKVPIDWVKNWKKDSKKLILYIFGGSILAIIGWLSWIYQIHPKTP